MSNPTCRTCDRSADAGAYCRSCAAGIMAIDTVDLGKFLFLVLTHMKTAGAKLPPWVQVVPMVSGSGRFLSGALAKLALFGGVGAIETVRIQQLHRGKHRPKRRCGRSRTGCYGSRSTRHSPRETSSS